MIIVFFFFFKQKTAYEMLRSLVGSEMCIRDRDKAALVLFFMGCGFLLPWNAFIMEQPYFDELYPGQHIIASFAAWNMGALFCTQLVLVLIGPKFPVGCRVVTGFSLLLVALLVSIPIESSLVHILLVVVLAIGDGIVQGSVYGFAGQISPFHTSAVMSGNGASGTIVSLLALCTAGGIEDKKFAFRVFFFLCSLQIALCIVSWFYMRTLAEAQDLKRTMGELRACCTTACCSGRLGTDDVDVEMTVGSNADTCENVLEAPQYDADDIGGSGYDKAGQDDELESRELVEEDVVPDDGGESTEKTQIWTPRSLNRMKLKALEDASAQAVEGLDNEGVWMDLRMILSMTKVIRFPAAMVCLNFVVTLSMFPGVSLEFPDTSDWGKIYPMLLATMYNLSDMMGRMCFCLFPDYCSPTKPRVVWLTVTRCAFVPVVVGVWAGVLVIPNLLGLALLFAFGLTNGVASTASMVYAPMLVVNEDGKEVASILMTFFLMTGLAIGAGIGNALTASSGNSH
eukprot:TRINITY_DN22130_c0_g1_i1.p1 TRINITY_DN22130_c0_g1~~TRINITY_DN22130_c0_g1_i1.p1  ORF type:complete len:512 (+),score=158.76 TRINITY_DN22130_c0_g1_i1:38-1573(+)